MLQRVPAAAGIARARYPEGPYVERERMSGFAGVMALVLAETIAGASVLTWASPLWNETKRSFFTIWIVADRRAVRLARLVGGERPARSPVTPTPRPRCGSRSRRPSSSPSR